MANIVLIGMSGAGKSTLGVLLAKALNYDFIDTDLLIQQQEGKLLQEIIQEKGIDGFKCVEENTVLNVQCDHTVIATGGSVVYSETAMEHLKRYGQFVYIAVEFKEIERRIRNIHTRGIVIGENQSLEDVFNERIHLYERYADITVSVNKKTIEETVVLLVDALVKKGEQ